MGTCRPRFLMRCTGGGLALLSEASVTSDRASSSELPSSSSKAPSDRSAYPLAAAARRRFLPPVPFSPCA